MYIMVDVEADGPYPGGFSMIELGAVVCRDTSRTFHGLFRPISEDYDPKSLEVFGRTREETLVDPFEPADLAMSRFYDWIMKLRIDESLCKPGTRPMFISDNNGYDWQWVNHYFWRFLGLNPFGHSSTNLGSMYKGRVGDTRKNFKHLRKTKHTHNPVDDAMGNVEALVHMKENMGQRLTL